MTDTDVREALFEEFGIEMTDYFYTENKYNSRHLRILGQMIEISDQNFDRWANSVECELDYSRMKRKRFIREMTEILK